MGIICASYLWNSSHMSPYTSSGFGSVQGAQHIPMFGTGLLDTVIPPRLFLNRSLPGLILHWLLQFPPY